MFPLSSPVPRRALSPAPDCRAAFPVAALSRAFPCSGRAPFPFSPVAGLMADLGADSLDMVEIAMAAEDAFGIELDDEAWSHDMTVAQAVDAIMGAAE